MILEYIQKIKDWPVPKTGKEVATFLGSIRQVLWNLHLQYSALTNQLNGIRKAEKILWNKEIEWDFIQLKKAFTDDGIQAFSDFRVGDLFILTLDWSKENIAGVLSQQQDGRGDSSDVGEGSVTSMSKTIPVTRRSC